MDDERLKQGKRVFGKNYFDEPRPFPCPLMPGKGGICQKFAHRSNWWENEPMGSPSQWDTTKWKKHRPLDNGTDAVL